MEIKFTEVKPNQWGHSRHVCHFLNLLKPEEKSQEFSLKHGLNSTSIQYKIALSRAKRIGGRKFHNKQFGGGIVFTISARTIEELESQIKTLLSE
jgi:hypothetical protein